MTPCPSGPSAREWWERGTQSMSQPALPMPMWVTVRWWMIERWLTYHGWTNEAGALSSSVQGSRTPHSQPPARQMDGQLAAMGRGRSGLGDGQRRLVASVKYVNWEIVAVEQGYEVVRYEGADPVPVATESTWEQAWARAQVDRALTLAEPTTKETAPVHSVLRGRPGRT